MGFCQLAIFGGYAIYFRSYPDSARATGIRSLQRPTVAARSDALGLLTAQVCAGYVVVVVEICRHYVCVFLIGPAVLLFLPETSDKPSPE